MTPVIVTHRTPARLGVTNSTILNPKCDILFIPDGVLGVGEAMRRREFIKVFGSAVFSWPPAARDQRTAGLPIPEQRASAPPPSQPGGP